MRKFLKIGAKAGGFPLMCLAVAWSGLAFSADLVKLGSEEVITSADLSQYLDRRIDLRGSARNKWGVESILREMALTRALVREGARIGEARLPGREGERFDDAYAFAVFKKLSPACEPPANGAAARKFYDETPEAFTVPPMARLGRVMLPAANKVAGESAASWLQAQARAIAAGSRTFADVVKEADSLYRLEPQGDLGWVVLLEENAILKTLASTKAGDMVGPVREGDFVYLFSIAEKRESRRLAWDEVAVSASARAVNYCRQTGKKKLEEDLLSKYGVVMDRAGIDSLFDKSDSAK